MTSRDTTLRAPDAAGRPSRRASDGSAPIRALVVDDDLSQRILVDAALSGAGLVVVEAATGDEALDRFREARPDIVLLDVVMPGIDGYETCRRLRALPGGDTTPIIMMTGLDDTDSIERAYDAGATDFTTKPLNGSLLTHRVRYLLRASDDARMARESAQRLAQAQRLARLVPWEYEPETGQIRWSSHAFEVLGLPPLDGSDLEDFLRWVHHEDRDRLRRALEARDPGEIEYRLIPPDGRERTIHQDADLIPDPASGSLRVVGAAQDVTERRRAEQQAARLAYYDSLTGLPNRALLSSYLEQALSNANRHDHPMAVLAIDLDLFKQVNDMHGHAAGDALLVEAAERITRCLRSGDATFRLDGPDAADIGSGEALAARLGGDEFVAVLPRLANPQDAATVAQRVIDQLGLAYAVGSTEVLVSASIGIAVLPDNGRDVDTLLRRADAAMYQAKERGRNNYQFFTPRMHERSRRRAEIEHGLRLALAPIEHLADGPGDHEFLLHFQPKISVETRQVVGVEALARWESPSLGPVSPAEFIPVAEGSGLIVPLGDWILRQACRTVDRLDVAGRPLPLAVNISARQFRDPEFVERIETILAETGFDPGRLELELTEGVVMQDTQQSQQVLDRLKRLGVRVAIDDFGTGYSSLSYLTRFPFDTVKIDQSFVKLIGEDRNNAIVSAIIALSHTLGLDIVAEGVEEQAQHDFLAAFGRLDIQGFYFARPMPGPDLLAWIDANR